MRAQSRAPAEPRSRASSPWSWWRTARRDQRVVVLGVLAAMTVTAGLGGYLAMINPPYQTDEIGHVGYVIEVREGRLPTLETPIPAGDDEVLATAAGRRWPFATNRIHIANNPPFPYLVAIAPAAVTSALDVRAGPLLGVRLTNLAGAVLAVGLTALLGWELSGRARTGLVAAGLVATTIVVAQGAAPAYVEGPAQAATTGVAWGLARYARTRTPQAALHLGLWCAAAAAVRPMALAYAGVAGLLALGLAWRSDGVQQLLPRAVLLAGPALLLTGWFYALNLYRYGDPTGAGKVHELNGSQATRGWTDVLFSRDSFLVPFDYLVTQVNGQFPWWGPINPRQVLVSGGAVAAVLGAVAVAALGRRSSRGSAVAPSPVAWGALAAVSVVPAILVSLHMASGGAGHPRYLLPVVPVVASALAMLAQRTSRWVPVAVLAALGALQLSRARVAGHLHLDPFWGPILDGPLVGQPQRSIALTLTWVATAAMVAALAWLAAHPAREPDVSAP